MKQSWLATSLIAVFAVSPFAQAGKPIQSSIQQNGINRVQQEIRQIRGEGYYRAQRRGPWLKQEVIEMQGAPIRSLGYIQSSNKTFQSATLKGSLRNENGEIVSLKAELPEPRGSLTSEPRVMLKEGKDLKGQPDGSFEVSYQILPRRESDFLQNDIYNFTVKRIDGEAFRVTRSSLSQVGRNANELWISSIKIEPLNQTGHGKIQIETKSMQGSSHELSLEQSLFPGEVIHAKVTRNDKVQSSTATVYSVRDGKVHETRIEFDGKSKPQISASRSVPGSEVGQLRLRAEADVYQMSPASAETANRGMQTQGSSSQSSSGAR